MYRWYVVANASIHPGKRILSLREKTYVAPAGTHDASFLGYDETYSSTRENTISLASNPGKKNDALAPHQTQLVGQGSCSLLSRGSPPPPNLTIDPLLSFSRPPFHFFLNATAPPHPLSGPDAALHLGLAGCSSAPTSAGPARPNPGSPPWMGCQIDATSSGGVWTATGKDGLDKPWIRRQDAASREPDQHAHRGQPISTSREQHHHDAQQKQKKGSDFLHLLLSALA
jgi:hypothetical protein